jgi:hypothetical protein
VASPPASHGAPPPPPPPDCALRGFSCLFWTLEALFPATAATTAAATAAAAAAEDDAPELSDAALRRSFLYWLAQDDAPLTAWLDDLCWRPAIGRVWDPELD